MVPVLWSCAAASDARGGRLSSGGCSSWPWWVLGSDKLFGCSLARDWAGPPGVNKSSRDVFHGSYGGGNPLEWVAAKRAQGDEKPPGDRQKAWVSGSEPAPLRMSVRDRRIRAVMRLCTEGRWDKAQNAVGAGPLYDARVVREATGVTILASRRRSLGSTPSVGSGERVWTLWACEPGERHHGIDRGAVHSPARLSPPFLRLYPSRYSGARSLTWPLFFAASPAVLPSLCGYEKRSCLGGILGVPGLPR